MLSQWNRKDQVEIFAPEDRPLLKKAATLLRVMIQPHLSALCFHQQGGAKKMLRAVDAFIKPDDFVFKTDVHSYYFSINHSILMETLETMGPLPRLTALIWAYIQRTIMGINVSHQARLGIPKGGSISPILGAVYLNPLDQKMQKWVDRGDVFYARFMDDIILIARKRHIFRQAKREMIEELTRVRLSLRPEKTFLGRAHKGFDLLGYRIECQPDAGEPASLIINEISINKALEKAGQRYARGGHEALDLYLKRWKTWALAGLKTCLLDNIDKVLDRLKTTVVSCIQVQRRYNSITSISPKLKTILNGGITCSGKLYYTRP